MGIKGFTEYHAKDAELYNRMRWWLGLTWGDVLDKASDLYPSKVGLVDDDGRLTYQELRQKVDGLALGLIDLGIQPRDRVLIQIPNWPEYAWAFFALEKIGAIPVLLLPRHRDAEINYLSQLSEAKALILPLKYRNVDYKPIIESVLRKSSTIERIITVREDRIAPFWTWRSLLPGSVQRGKTCPGSRNVGPIPWRLLRSCLPAGRPGYQKPPPGRITAFYATRNTIPKPGKLQAKIRS